MARVMAGTCLTCQHRTVPGLDERNLLLSGGGGHDFQQRESDYEWGGHDCATQFFFTFIIGM
jgi:hypothetical protein